MALLPTAGPMAPAPMGAPMGPDPAAADPIMRLGELEMRVAELEALIAELMGGAAPPEPAAPQVGGETVGY